MFDQHMLEAEKVFGDGFGRLRKALEAGQVHSPRIRRLTRRRERQVVKLCEKIRRG